MLDYGPEVQNITMSFQYIFIFRIVHSFFTSEIALYYYVIKGEYVAVKASFYFSKSFDYDNSFIKRWNVVYTDNTDYTIK